MYANLNQKNTLFLPDSFWEKLEPQDNGCHIWTGAIWNRGGYGRYSHKGKSYVVHRLVLAHHLGRELLREELACHSCDNPPCANIEHLWLGSASDNTRDMVAKGRNYEKPIGPSGFRGVYAKAGKWAAQIHKDGATEYLGLYDTPELAHEAYLAKRKEHD